MPVFTIETELETLRGAFNEQEVSGENVALDTRTTAAFVARVPGKVLKLMPPQIYFVFQADAATPLMLGAIRTATSTYACRVAGKIIDDTLVVPVVIAKRIEDEAGLIKILNKRSEVSNFYQIPVVLVPDEKKWYWRTTADVIGFLGFPNFRKAISTRLGGEKYEKY